MYIYFTPHDCLEIHSRFGGINTVFVYIAESYFMEQMSHSLNIHLLKDTVFLDSGHHRKKLWIFLSVSICVGVEVSAYMNVHFTNMIIRQLHV